MVRGRISSIGTRLSRYRILGHQLETRLGFVPKAIEPGCGRLQTGPIEEIDIARAFGAMGDKARAFQLPQVPGDRRPADFEGRRQLADARWPVRQDLHDPPALGITKRLEVIVRESSKLFA